MGNSWVKGQQNYTECKDYGSIHQGYRPEKLQGFQSCLQAVVGANGDFTEQIY